MDSILTIHEISLSVHVYRSIVKLVFLRTLLVHQVNKIQSNFLIQESSSQFETSCVTYDHWKSGNDQ